MTELAVNISKTISAPIDTVFDAWLNPEKLAHFMIPAPGMPSPAVKIDSKEGGEFEIVMKVGDKDIPHTGHYVEVTRPHKLSFTWASPVSLDDSVVTLNFTQLSSDSTRIDLSHVKFVNEEARSDHEGGWENILAALDDALAISVAS